MATPFRVVVYNSAGQAQGELLTVNEISDTRSLDKIGSCQLRLAGNDPHIEMLTPGSQLDIFDEFDGYIGRYLFKTSNLKVNTDIPDLIIRADEVLVELRHRFVGFNRNYYFNPVDQVVGELTALASGWSAEVDSGIGNTAVTYMGESIFAAIDTMRDRWGQHFRRKTTNALTPRVLQFGAFGVESGLIMQNLQGQSQPSFDQKRYVAEVLTIEQTTDAEEIINRVVARGAGQGAGQLTLQDATGGTYTVQSAFNADGTRYYYIEDAASIALYGVRERVVTFSSITPISNSTTDIQRAKNALLAAAEAYMSRHLSPKVEYGLSLRALRQNVDVGDLVRLRYRGFTKGVEWLNVDEDFYLMDLTRKRSITGERSAMASITSVSQRRTSDQDVIVDVVRDISALKLHLAPQVYWSENTYVQPVQGVFDPPIPEDSANAQFYIEFDNQVTAIHKVRIRLSTTPFSLPADIFINFVSSSQYLLASLTQDDKYPQGIYIFIDGVNYTTQLGGPFNIGLSQPFSQEFDITDILIAAPGGLRSRHLIELGATVAQGEMGYPAFRPSGVVGSGISRGMVTLNVRIQGTAQAVIAT